MKQVQDKQAEFMRTAIELAHLSVQRGGGPFGAVVVRDGKIIGRGHNQVPLRNDPTAHAEVEAIRQACSDSGDFHLDGCELYTSCMPCPMCLGAAYWAHISHIYYAATAQDAANIGFSDEFIADELARPLEQRALPMSQLEHQRALAVFRAWHDSDNKTEY